jgi:prepilin-type N-terminal cleavage/methylation domain-containing protein
MNIRGFTLIEVVIVVGLIAAIAGFSVPMSVDFYNTQITKSTSDEIFSALKKAQAYATFRRGDSQYGVAFDSDDDLYVVFKDSYGGSPTSFDEGYDLNGVAVTFDPIISPADEITFTKGTGMPNATTSLTLTKGSISQQISICESGLIELGSECGE